MIEVGFAKMQRASLVSCSIRQRRRYRAGTHRRRELDRLPGVSTGSKSWVSRAPCAAAAAQFANLRIIFTRSIPCMKSVHDEQQTGM